MKSLCGIFVFLSLIIHNSAQIIIDNGRRGGSNPGPTVIDVDKKTVPAPVINVLFVGNQYSKDNSLTQLVQYMAAQVKKPMNIKIGTLFADNTTFGGHLKNPETKKALAKYKWDYVVLQGHADTPLNHPEEFYKDGRTIANLIQESGAAPLFFMTWADALEQDKTMEIFNAYKKISLDSKSLMAPVGSAWERAYKAHPKLTFYQKSTYAPGPHGSYLAAAVLTTVLTKQTVVGQKNTGLKSVSFAQGQALQKIAVKTVIDYDNHLKKIQAAKKGKK